MNRFQTTAALVACLAAAGCTTVDRLNAVGQAPALTPIIDPRDRDGDRMVTMPMPRQETQMRQANSLWASGARSFFKDQRANQIGDVVTARNGKTIEVTVMVLNGLLNTSLLAQCKELEINAVGYSGVDAGLVTVHKRAPVVQKDGSTVDYGFVGDVDSVNPEVLRQALDAGFMPVVSPLCADAEGNVLNVNADTVAAAIGAALGAEKLLLCTGAPGILENIADPRSIVSYTDLAGLQRLQSAGSLADGMLPKASAIEAAIRGGVRRVHVISFRNADALLAEVFTNEGTGTLIVNDVQALSAAEQGTQP